jgi:1,4-alpha-glucan branching enzyme
MPNKHSKNIGKKQKVTFTFESSHAEEVILMGDFNEWNPKKHPMQHKGDGTWLKSVMLSPGKYEYKFMVNGQWVEDVVNNQSCPNCFGTRNSIIEMREK